jgi:hypothetical protein
MVLLAFERTEEQCIHAEGAYSEGNKYTVPVNTES